MFKNVANLALGKLKAPEISSVVLSNEDLVIYFEALASDFAKLHYNNISCEEFKASIARYDILAAPEVAELMKQIVSTIKSLASAANS